MTTYKYRIEEVDVPVIDGSIPNSEHKRMGRRIVAVLKGNPSAALPLNHQKLTVLTEEEQLN